MLAIGRGLMSKPKLLLLDEPSWGLSPLMSKNIFEAARQINNSGVTILLVEQNVRMALGIGQSRLCCGERTNCGRRVTAGICSNSQHIREAYLGTE